MDNVSFHKGVKTQELIEGEGCNLLYLPLYLPGLNPTENQWLFHNENTEHSNKKATNMIVLSTKLFQLYMYLGFTLIAGL
jgi:hypothetical protein